LKLGEDREGGHRWWIQVHLTGLARDGVEFHRVHGRGYFWIPYGAPSAAQYQTTFRDETVDETTAERVAQAVRTYDPATQIVICMRLGDEPAEVYVVNIPTGDDIENEAVRTLKLRDQEDRDDITRHIAGHPDWSDEQVARALQAQHMLLRDFDRDVRFVAAVRRELNQKES